MIIEVWRVQNLQVGSRLETQGTDAAQVQRLSADRIPSLEEASLSSIKAFN